MPRRRSKTRRSARPPEASFGTVGEDVAAPEPDPRCELCRREGLALTRHHLVPRAKGGHHGPLALLCGGCHNQVHRLFTHDELATGFDSVEALRTEPRMVRYLRWARRQKPGKRIRVKKPRR